MPKGLLTRDAFREAVFERDGRLCVFCKSPALDAHHIIERRLWPDGGYYVDNGASVCEPCHLACERTDHSTESVREAAGIERVLLPPHLESKTCYDKWGNPVLENGKRLQGELFLDTSVQKILGDHLLDFTTLVKYPRTAYLPWSPGAKTDLSMDTTILYGKRVIITEKMDGENTSIYRDAIHARSIDGRHHVSRDWVKNLQSRVGYEIPEGWRICGENLWAKHSIEYTNLKSYFYAFAIWNEYNQCMAWDETMEYFSILGLEPVPVIYDGVFNKEVEAKMIQHTTPEGEGYVIRPADSFSWSEFRTHVGKWVRPDHVQTHGHWMRARITKNTCLSDQ